MGLKRLSGLTRETPVIIRSAWPLAVTESLNGLKDYPPEQVERLERLAESVDFGFSTQCY